AAVNVTYEGHSLDLRTDTLGHASARMPLSLTGSLCTVTVESEKQQKSLKAGLNAFDFALVTPVVPPEILVDPGPDDEEDKKGSEEENKVTEEEKKNDPKEEVKNEDEKEEDEKEDEKEEEKEEEEKKPEEKTEPVSKGWILMLILLLLILAVLTALTYYFCKGMLFG
ncbi:MAG: hypothetical protein K2L41_00975, partial [Muribaculaceae bacterium]|nr:hypothetical protein [Muribaculaceae bacterium]